MSRWFASRYRQAASTAALLLLLSSAVVTPDYIITNDAEWGTIPAGLLSSGGNIAVRALPSSGVYTEKTITATPSATLHFYAETVGSWPRVNGIIFHGAENIKVTGLQIETNRWTSGPQGIVRFRGTSSDLEISENVIVGNYRGTVDYDLDVTVDTYPEYACILPVFNSSGVITSFVIERPNVGDLLADGTHNMVFNEGVTGAVGTFTVSGGVITGTTLTNGGTSSHSDTTGIGVRSKVITWTGQNRMVSYLNYGFEAYDGATQLQNVTIKDNSIRLLQSAIKYGSLTGGFSLIEGNSMSKMYADYISLSVKQNNYLLTIRWNYATLPFSKSGDPGDPHADFVQLYMDDADGGDGTTPVNLVGTSIYGNICVDGGNCRGGVQAIFCADTPVGIYYEGLDISWNFVASKRNSTGSQISNMKNCFVWANSYIRWDPTDTTNNVAVFAVSIPRVSSSGAIGANLVGRNVFEQLSTNSDAQVYTDIYPNTITGKNGVTIPYTDVYTNITASRGTIAEIMAAYAPKVAYSTQGPFHDQTKVNHATRTRDRTAEPSWMKFDAVTNQTAGATVTSNWACLIGGPDTVSVHANGDEYRFADDDAGTNATSWGTATTTEARGRYGQVRKAASSTPGATVTPTLTAGTTNNVFSITTANIVAGYRNAYTHLPSITTGNYREETIDVGASDAARIVTVFTLTSSNNIINAADVTINGNAMTRRTGATGKIQCFSYALGAASGATTATLRVTNTSGGSYAQLRSWVFVSYPSGGTLVDDVEGASASGTSTSTATDVSVTTGGHVFFVGGYTTSGGSAPLGPTWNGTDTLVEDYDAAEESVPAVAGHIIITETNTTRDLALPANGSGAKTILAISWGPPA